MGPGTRKPETAVPYDHAMTGAPREDLDSTAEAPPPTPRWVLTLGLIVALLVIGLVIFMLVGGHQPRVH